MKTLYWFKVNYVCWVTRVLIVITIEKKNKKYSSVGIFLSNVDTGILRIAQTENDLLCEYLPTCQRVTLVRRWKQKNMITVFKFV